MLVLGFLGGNKSLLLRQIMKDKRRLSEDNRCGMSVMTWCRYSPEGKGGEKTLRSKAAAKLFNT